MPISKKNIKIFVDTSVIIAAIMSHHGGTRMLFRLGEASTIQIIAGKSVLQEADEVLHRKASDLLPTLAEMLAAAHLQIGDQPSTQQRSRANQLVDYLPDALVFAEALQSEAHWFATHDRKHFLNNPHLANLPFLIGAPGDILIYIREKLSNE